MIRKKLEELNLLDNYLFEAMVSYPELGEQFGRKVLEIILQRKIGKLNVIPQKVYPGSDTDLRGARLDVYLEEDATETVDGVKTESVSVYDIEPDKNGRTKAIQSLPRRVRFYHSKIDSKGLKAGEDFHSLKNVIIIMIMPYDPFGLDRMVYTVQSGCREEPDMEYDDGAKTIFLYTRGGKGIPSEEVRQLLEYFEHSTEENACSDELREIHGMLMRVRRDEEVEVNYMKIFEQEQMIREDGIEEGINIGRREGRCEGRLEGEELQLIQLILKKVQKGKDLNTIAGEVEETAESISRLYDIIKCNSDKTKEEIYELYHETK